MSIVKPKLTFLEVQVEFVIGQAVKFCQPTFGERPETFDAVDMELATGKCTLGVVDTVVGLSFQDKPIVCLSTVDVVCPAGIKA